ncbi:MAG: hypothetical protein WAX04_13785 [Oscillospiraceae bacterium]
MNNKASIYVAIMAFIGASIAQIVAHCLTMNRERKKWYRETYQKLFAPIISEVYNFIEIRTHFRKGHDVEQCVDDNLIKMNIIKHIGGNIMYADPDLINSYQRHSYRKMVPGFRMSSEIYDLELILSFLDNLYSVVKKLRIFDKETICILNKYRVLYLIWINAFYLFEDNGRTIEFMKYKFYFNTEMFTDRYYRKLRKMMINDTSTVSEIVIKHVINTALPKENDKKEINKIFERLLKN